MRGKTEHLANRLADILCRLNQGEHLSVHNLASDYHVDKRTIQKDLNARLINLPIYKDKEGKYALESAFLGKFNLEEIKLLIHASGLRGLYPELNNRLLSILLGRYKDNTLKVIGHRYEEIDDRTEDFYRIQDFILKHQEIKFQYDGKDYRDMKPYRLINQSGIWYLAAEDKDSKLKSFHFKKLKRIAFTGHYYSPKPEIHVKIEESDSIWFEGEIQTIILKVSPEVSQYFKRRQLLPRQSIIEEYRDGSLILETRTGNMKMLVPKLQYWIPGIKIIEPVDLKEKIIKQLKDYVSEEEE